MNWTSGTIANQSVQTNRRLGSPIDAGRQSECAACAPPALSAAVAHLGRYTPRNFLWEIVRDFVATK